MDLEKVQLRLREFSKERDWKQYHNPKNLVMALSVEVAELVEIFQWSNDGGLSEIQDPKIRKKIENEIADVFNYLVQLVDILDIDLEESSLNKIKENAKKYPIEKSKGRSVKYTDFDEWYKLKRTFNAFSSSWESYVSHCRKLIDNKFKFNLTKDHEVYRLIIKTIVAELSTLVDERLYKVKASVGQSGLAGIPWLSVMDKELTESTQNGFYISYLFSRNAKRLYVSIALGATQFEDLYGENDKATEKIIKAKELFVKNFNKYSPSDSFEQMDLIDPQDKEFIRQDFSPRMLRRAKNYAGGSFFTKSYNLVDPDFTEDGLASDPKKYIDSYRKIVSDPASSALLEVLDESVFEESDKKQRKNYDYELPSFNPKNIEPKNKNTKKGQSSKPNKPSPPSKKVGDAGEKHVYEYEKNKLVKCGREDLANMIVKQYEDLSFFPGYDIQSFDEEGKD